MHGVHQLVIRAFVGECPEGYVVEHINQDKLDNRLANLRYVPNDDRIFYFAEAHPQCKFSCATIAQVRREYAAGGVTMADLSADFGISPTHVSNVVRWVHRKRG
jgi:hypothetical protein